MVKILSSGKVKWIKGNTAVDISKEISSYVNFRVDIEEGVKVKTLFSILKNNPAYLATFDRIWGKDFVTEGLQSKKKSSINQKSKIEFYWFLDQFEKDSVQIMPIPSVHGIEGKNGTFGLDFLPASEIRDLEVVVNEKIQTELIDLSLRPTLGQILYALIWELSFYGPPKTRDASHPKHRK